MQSAIADIRKEYRLQTLNEADVDGDAIKQFQIWWNEALDSKIEEVNAMTLATSSLNGQPSARIVLLKDFNENGFVFFTNYLSSKGKQLDINPCVALVFFWKEIERQVRIEGKVNKLPAPESDAYFCTRPTGSRIGAWASPQSEVIHSRDILEKNVSLYSNKFSENIPRPDYWGGYTVLPQTIEFWQGRSNRLHDRLLYSRENTGWKIARLAP